jgi:predicted AAA+ superfamily ATPase
VLVTSNKFGLYIEHSRYLYSKEVDFVLEKEGVVIGLEVKSSKDGTSLGLPVFCKQFNPDHVFTIGTDGISFEEFFTMKPRRFLEIERCKRIDGG